MAVVLPSCVAEVEPILRTYRLRRVPSDWALSRGSKVLFENLKDGGFWTNSWNSRAGADFLRF